MAAAKPKIVFAGHDNLEDGHLPPAARDSNNSVVSSRKSSKRERLLANQEHFESTMSEVSTNDTDAKSLNGELSDVKPPLCLVLPTAFAAKTLPLPCGPQVEDYEHSTPTGVPKADPRFADEMKCCVCNVFGSSRPKRVEHDQKKLTTIM